MDKGHFILAAVVFSLMITLPAVAVTNPEETAASSSLAESPNQTDALQVLRTDTGLVETVSVTDYIFGVVAAEMPMSYPEEAIKAQAVAAYTLALHRMEERSQNPPQALKGADMTDDSGTDQSFITREVARAKWGARAEEYEARLDAWIEEVLPSYVAFEDAPALTVYHSISGGRTESAETVWGSAIAYLVPVESVGDLMSEDYISEKRLTKAEFLQGLSALDSSLAGNLSLDTAVGESEYSASGTVLSISLFGKHFTGKQLREAFGLRSANFDVAVEGEQVVFTVRGYGHLVGMSQYGAKTMAQQGSTWQEILTWYYPGCQIKTRR